MDLLIVIITYNRLEYTKRTIQDLLDTIKIPHYILVVDNASTDGTPEYLEKLLDKKKIDGLVLNDENYYPGKACNIGWEEGLEAYPQATHLMRLDNDFVLLKGWDTTAEKYFDKIDNLGQLGLDYDAIKDNKEHEKEYNGMILNHWPGVVGGVNIIPKGLWDLGIRYEETRWIKKWEGISSPQEDSALSNNIKNWGFLVGHMQEKLAWTFADETNWSDYPDYYIKTMSERGYDDLVRKIKGKK